MQKEAAKNTAQKSNAKTQVTETPPLTVNVTNTNENTYHPSDKEKEKGGETSAEQSFGHNGCTQVINAR